MKLSCFRFFCLPAIALWLAACANQSGYDAGVSVEVVDQHLAAQHFFQPIFTPMDCELIGQAEKGEVEEHFPALYFFLDRNHDREISREEFVGAQVNATSEEQAYLFLKMDADGDGSVTPEEYKRFAYFAFDLLDVDQDGYLTEIEVDMQSFRKAPKP